MEQLNLQTIIVDKPVQFVCTLLKNKNAGDLFLKIANCLIAQDTRLIIRTDCSTIGLSRPGERYLFYVAIGPNRLSCRFKHWDKTEEFPNASFRYYKDCCIEVLAFYAEHPDLFKIGIPVSSSHTSEANISKTGAQGTTTAQIQSELHRDSTKRAKETGNQEKSCSTCFLRISERCTELSNRLCDDYQPGVFISQEEMSGWPTGGDATTSRENFRERYHRGRST